MKADVGEMRFSAQYQQAPVPVEGNLIKWAWFEIDDHEPDRSKGRIIQSWDTAGDVGAANAYSVASPSCASAITITCFMCCVRNSTIQP